jgi:pilus assembly protein FimV
VTQQSGSQFEDDLTIGVDEDESFATDSIDLLGIGGDESSPIARLKSIILSIDWEINDDILQQLDDELHDLGEIWAGDKVKQVYVQGLSKIGRYIYKEKAGAHPNSIKLLITFYHNLEKIVTNEESMSEEEKKQLLLADVSKFDRLKSQIGKPSEPSSPTPVAAAQEDISVVSEFTEESEDRNELKTLKALVLGIDWEINDREMQGLGDEVKRLEGVFRQNKAKLILLQGIGALSSYINKKRSQSNTGVFPLLHSFFDCLENISVSELSPADEKQLLLSEVSKFNEFKAEIAKEPSSSLSVASDDGSVIATDEPVPEEHVAAISDAPASFAGDDVFEESDISETDVEVAEDVSSRLASVFGDDDEESDGTLYKESDIDAALAGVNVETDADDDSDEEALPYEDGTIAPALADVEQDSSFSVEKLADDLSVAPPTVKPEAIVGDDVEEEEEFSLEDTVDIDEPVDSVENDDILQGVDVETEADDDSSEESLPMEAGELAPALSGADDDSGFNAESIAAEFDKSDSDAIENRLGAFFDEEVATSSEGWVSETSDQSFDSANSVALEDDNVVAALSGVEADSSTPVEEIVEEAEVIAEDEELLTEEDDTTVEDPLSIFDDDDEPVPALFDSEEETLTEESDPDKDIYETGEKAIEEELSFLDDDVDDDLYEKPEEILFEDIEPENDEESTTIIEEDIETFTETEEIVEEVLFDSFEEDDDELPEETDLLVESPEEEQTSEEAALAFFDDEIEVEETVEQIFSSVDTEASADEIAFEVDSDDVEEDDEIEFTIPGDELGSSVEETLAIGSDEEVIEFAIPGETAAPAAATAIVAGTALSAIHDIEIVEDDDIVKEVIEDVETVEEDDVVREVIEDEEVIFEAVADDVELDLLPGEEYDDFLTVDEEVPAPATVDELVEFTAVEDEFDTGRYESLAILVAAIQGNVGEEGVQDILSEINQLRSTKDTKYLDKTFLQLLSTISQYIEKNSEDSNAFELMQEIVSGLEMCDSSESSMDAVQEKLFTCTSQILLLQAKGMTTTVVESEYETVQEEDAILPAEIEEDSKESLSSTSFTAMGEDEQLASFVQKELADIRKLFVEEIGSLRKELADKK